MGAKAGRGTRARPRGNSARQRGTSSARRHGASLLRACIRESHPRARSRRDVHLPVLHGQQQQHAVEAAMVANAPPIHQLLRKVPGALRARKGIVRCALVGAVTDALVQGACTHVGIGRARHGPGHAAQDRGRDLVPAALAGHARVLNLDANASEDGICERARRRRTLTKRHSQTRPHRWWDERKRS